jgi:4-hydroxy-tetrahydrodipicolinate synthase
MTVSPHKHVFGGVNAAVLTAMRADLSIDLARMIAHGRWLLANGCNGLAILGTTGEANSLGIHERIGVMEGFVEAGVPASVLLPGTGTTAITDTVLLTRRAEELGCRGALVLPPFFYKNPSEDGLFAYFSEVIQRVGGDIGIYLYHFPAQSAVPFTVPFIARLLAAYPGKVRGIKDSSGDFANTSAYADHFAADGFEVYCGDDGALNNLLNIGGAGCITAAANVGCSVSAQVYANRGTQAATDAQVQLTAVRKAVTSAPLIPGLKSLVARNLDDPAWLNIRPPHLNLSREQEMALFAALDATGLKLAGAPALV